MGESKEKVAYEDDEVQDKTSTKDSDAKLEKEDVLSGTEDQGEEETICPEETGNELAEEGKQEPVEEEAPAETTEPQSEMDE